MNAVESINDLLGREAQEGAFSGAQAAWCQGRDPRTEVAFAGTTARSGGSAIDARTLFDIASVTKLFTATAALVMVEKRLIRLDACLGDAIDVSAGLPLGRATLRQLLTHRAGFAGWLPLFESVPLERRSTDRARAAVIDLALAAAPVSDPGAETVYSDLGYIALTAWLERTAGHRLDRIIAEHVTGPLGLDRVQFRPLGQVPARPADIAATESCPWRGRVLVGEVHDDNAWTMGGVSGHAGLFAAAADTARLGAAWLAWRQNGGLISRALAREATSPGPGGRGLGWDLRSETGSTAGTRFAPGSFGHLGFTGCSLWVDPDRELAVALHTNRVHYGRDNHALQALRPRFHDRLIEALEG